MFGIFCSMPFKTGSRNPFVVQFVYVGHFHFLMLTIVMQRNLSEKQKSFQHHHLPLDYVV